MKPASIYFKTVKFIKLANLFSVKIVIPRINRIYLLN